MSGAGCALTRDRADVYTTCYHCLSPLGRNVVLAPFPVGRRVAFDAERARLWAVCDACGRWNLAPLDERWAAIDECERLFRRAPRRYGTPNIALAALADGTELVRIGPAPRPEFAAWRYGGELLRTRARTPPVLWRAAAAYATAVAAARQWATGEGGGRPPQELGLRTLLTARRRDAERVVAVVGASRLEHARSAGPTAADAPVIRRRHLADAVLVRPDAGAPWQLEVPHETGVVRLAGAAGLRVATVLLAAVNAHGVTPAVVRDALAKVDEAADPDGYFNRVLRTAWRWQWGRTPSDARPEERPAAAHVAPAEALAVALTGRVFWGRGGIGSAARQPLLGAPLEDRLALEIAAHEDLERRALAESLAALETAWRDAEALAQVVDAL
jgi:hypothetical protein